MELLNNETRTKLPFDAHVLNKRIRGKLIDSMLRRFFDETLVYSGKYSDQRELTIFYNIELY